MEVLLKTLVSTTNTLYKLNLHITKSKLAIIFIAIFSILFIYLIKWNGLSGDNYRNTIKKEGVGYYQYIAEVLEGDLSNQRANGTFLLKTNTNRVVNKYTIGTAVLVSPFILPVYIAQKISGTSIDLYSEYYQKAYSIAALFYLVIGLMAFRKLLILYNTEAKVIAFSLFTIFAGTNLAYYSLIEPSMSHIYSFSLISIFMLKIKESTFNFTRQNIFLLAVILGLIVLVRPVNILIILIIPFLIFDNYKVVVNQLKANITNIIVAFVIFAAIISLQLFAWKIQTGQFLLWSYSNEGFYFSKPEILNFLFSFRKGAFVYTPLILLSTIVFILSRKIKIGFKLSALFFYTILIYIMSSWWNWYYGDSFGSRVLVDYMAFFILLFAIAIDKIKLQWQRAIVIISSIFIVLNIFQTYQYYYQIISPFDMNTEKYFYTFNKYGEENRNILGGNNDIIQYHKQKPIMVLEGSIGIIDQNSDNAFEYKISADELMNFESSFLEFSCNINSDKDDLSNVYWQISYSDSIGNKLVESRIKLNEIPIKENGSRTNNYTFRLPKPINSADYFSIKIENNTYSKFEITDFKIRVYGIIE